jgi:ParB-like chromosome segregation protein Spo0J
MEGDEYGRFADDIKKRGLQEPIVLHEHQILDGRNRYKACKQLGLTPQTKPYTGNDPLGYVLSANFHRRHLNESQRAMVAARVVTTKLGDNQHIKKEGIPNSHPHRPGIPTHEEC